MPGTKDDTKPDDELDVDDVDDEDTDEHDDEEEEPKPYAKEDGSVFTAKDFEALQTALRASRKEARDARRGKMTAPKPDDDKPDADDTKAADAARLKAEAETIAKWKPLVVNNAARSALTGAGLIGSPDRLLRLLDLDEIDVDSETGEIDGLTEQVTDLKKDYPHLFRKRGGGSINAADRRGGSGRDKRTPSQIQADQLLGRGGDDS